MKVGIQLYSVRNNMAKDPITTIEKVVNTGYRYLEVANHNAEEDSGVGFNVPAEEIKALLGNLNASIVSAHIFPLNPSKMDAILEYHKTIGTKFIVMPMDFYRDRAETLKKAEILNKVGEQCKNAGMELLYHNHFHEFQKFEGESVFDTIMNNTDPDLVKIELDTYWTMRGNQDPVEVLKKYGKRVRLVHQKDYPAGMEDQMDLLSSVEENNDYVDMDRFIRDFTEDSFIEVGKGIMDIQSIINTANDVCGAEYIILEQDYTKHDELESIKISMESFKNFKGIDW